MQNHCAKGFQVLYRQIDALAELQMVLNYCKSLKFEQDPDYNHIRQLFQTSFDKMKYERDEVYDWYGYLCGSEKSSNHTDNSAQLPIKKIINEEA